MSIETAAKDLACELMRQEYVEVLCHHDADGIAAGSIMATALYRAGIPFRLRVTHRLSEDTIPKTKPLLLCDLGSGIQRLPEDTMVIDHHIPVFDGPFHVNPRHDGIDGDYDMSASGAAYLVANAIGDNRDLAGLWLLGVIGDGQTLTGKNHEIYMDAIANGIISKKRGLNLPGRALTEQIILATEPFLPGLSGSEDAAEKLVATATEDQSVSYDLLCSLLVFSALETCNPEAVLKLWGDVWMLEREVIENARTMAFVIDACGKSGSGSTAASLCLRSSRMTDSAFETAKAHRMSLIQEMNRFISLPAAERSGHISCSNPHLASDLADSIHHNIMTDEPVIVSVTKDDGSCSCSIRAAGRNGTYLGEIVRSLAEECGGTGGGHQTRAGATMPCEMLDRFVSGIKEVW